MKKIGVVIVTYNRLEKLKYTLKCFDNQTVVPEYIIVVDNASDDGTAEYLATWRANESTTKKIVISNDTNLGGSGGFYTGLNRALKESAQWIWVQDDDAFPESDAIEKASIFLDGVNSDNISAISSQVINNNEIDYDHRISLIPRGKKWNGKNR